MTGDARLAVYSALVSLPKRCVDLTEDDIDDGLKSVASMRALLEHMARIARPDEGAAKILVAISRIATTACEWLEGKLHVAVMQRPGATRRSAPGCTYFVGRRKSHVGCGSQRG